MVTEREKTIGARLRAFRETLQIPRSRFAVAIGFGSERIASIEAGRAPLRYEVFKAVAQRYQISHFWLADGLASPKYPVPFDEASLAKVPPPRALFTEVYDKCLRPQLPNVQTEAMVSLERAKALLEGVEAILLDPHLQDETSREVLLPSVEKLAAALKLHRDVISSDLDLRKAVKGRIRSPRHPPGRKKK